MTADPLPYHCPATHASFYSTRTCAARLSKASAKEPVTVGLVFDPQANYAPCINCPGPILISSGERVAVTPVAPPRRVYPSTDRAEREAAAKKSRSFRTNEQGSLLWRFNLADPESKWTGTVCGCTKPRKEFSRPSKCRECVRDEDAKRRRAKGISVKKKKNAKVCEICGGKYYGKGLCWKHYLRKWKAENPKKARGESPDRSTCKKRWRAVCECGTPFYSRGAAYCPQCRFMLRSKKK